MTSIVVEVASRTEAAEGIACFELARPGGGPLPAFSAGSHIDVEVPGGFTRQYSLCNDASEQHRYRIAVLRDPASRGGSVGMHGVRAGDTLRISEPRNHFPLAQAERSLLFAGGIGVTPLLCMAQRLSKLGADFTLHYSTRSPERTAFREEIASSAYADRVVFHFDNGPVDQALSIPQALGACDSGTHIYVCGPAGYINAVVQVAQGMGWPSSQIHLEYFAAEKQDAATNTAFEVKLASSGKTYPIAADESVVAALNKAGIEILTSCEQGVCGTCVTRVLEGECDHRDLYFTDEEKAKHDQFTPCCSRAKTPLLVLDL